MQTMGEFASLTERLALMPDPALQQFAQMHKDDPFSLSLAVSESNRRRKMRTAQQGLAGMQQQPPVAEQEIAQMAEPVMPENVGIGALSAPNMQMPAGGIVGEEEMESQTMAGGGMVAFRAGGDVERYQFGGQPPASGGTEFAIPGMTQPSRTFLPQPGAPENQDPILRRMFRSMDLTAARRRAAEAQARIDRGLNYESDREAVLALQALESAAAAPSAATDVGVRGGIAENISGMDRRLAASPQTLAASAPAATTPAATTPAATTSAATTSAAPGAPKPPAAAGAPGATSAPAAPIAAGFDMTPTGLMALRKKLGEEINIEEPKNLKKAREELAAEEVEAKKEIKKNIERDQAKFIKAFEGREARLAERGAEIGKQKDLNMGLSLLNAGLAIMSTPGGLAMALGKGARVGTEQYASGIEKLRSAQDRLDEARDKLEDLKLNRAEMSAKEIREAEAGIKTAEIAGKQRGIEALSNMFNVSNKRADTMFNTLAETGIAVFREQQANVRNAASVAAQRDVAAASREATAASRMPALYETTRKNITAEAIKKFPFDAAGREAYEKEAFDAALRANPALAQYVGITPGGGRGAAQLNPSDAALVQKYMTGGG